MSTLYGCGLVYIALLVILYDVFGDWQLWLFVYETIIYLWLWLLYCTGDFGSVSPTGGIPDIYCGHMALYIGLFCCSR